MTGVGVAVILKKNAVSWYKSRWRQNAHPKPNSPPVDRPHPRPFRLSDHRCRSAVHWDHMAVSPTSLDVKRQAGGIHESFRQREKHRTCSLVTIHQMHESVVVLCLDPSSFDAKWQAESFPLDSRTNSCSLVTELTKAVWALHLKEAGCSCMEVTALFGCRPATIKLFPQRWLPTAFHTSKHGRRRQS